VSSKASLARRLRARRGELTGCYKLNEHKSVNKGIDTEGPLAKEFVEYLLATRPQNAGRSPVHFNPETSMPYVDIRKQCERLLEIANRIVRRELDGTKTDVLQLRARGASHIALRGKTPAALVRRREDDGRYVATVNRHYFNIEPELIQELVLGWSARTCTSGRSYRQTFSARSRRRSAARR
jgi:hypothetical protein